jgi:hypothetical protein
MSKYRRDEMLKNQRFFDELSELMETHGVKLATSRCDASIEFIFDDFDPDQRIDSDRCYMTAYDVKGIWS